MTMLARGGEKPAKYFMDVDENKGEKKSPLALIYTLKGAGNGLQRLNDVRTKETGFLTPCRK
jgi:hypothetical protein